MRIGLIGVGRIGAFHASALEAFPVAEACELSRRRGEPVPAAEVRR